MCRTNRTAINTVCVNETAKTTHPITLPTLVKHLEFAENNRTLLGIACRPHEVGHTSMIAPLVGRDKDRRPDVFYDKHQKLRRFGRACILANDMDIAW